MRILLLLLTCFICLNPVNARNHTGDLVRRRNAVTTCPLPRVPFGVVRPTQNATRAFRASVKPGTIVQLHCDPGYAMTPHDSNTTICLINGRWSNALGRCVELDLPLTDGACSLPMPCRHGHLDTRSVAFLNVNSSAHFYSEYTRDKVLVAAGSSIQLTCDLELEIKFGSAESTCLQNGTWSQTLGLCLPPSIPIGSCLLPDSIENGHLVVSGAGNQSHQDFFVALDGQISLLCDFGFEVVNGANNAKCGRYGWSNDLGHCKQVDPQNHKHTMEPAFETLQSRFSFTECGVTDVFLVGDDDVSKMGVAEPHEFPWMVKLEVMFENDPEFRKCGGTLINKRFVLTAAHCVTLGPLVGILVYLGKYNMSLVREPGQERQLVDARRVYVHPMFEFDAMKFDFALIELNSQVYFRRQIRHICLPDQEGFQCDGDAEGALDNDGMRMALAGIDSSNSYISTGWGVTKPLSTSESDVLKKFELRYVPYTKCRESYVDAKVIINDAQICAEPKTDSNLDTCEGDSGGPLMAYQDGRAFIVGITSFGAATCGESQTRPGVYSRVCRALPWIRSMLSGTSSIHLKTASSLSTPTGLENPIVSAMMRAAGLIPPTAAASSASIAADSEQLTLAFPMTPQQQQQQQHYVDEVGDDDDDSFVPNFYHHQHQHQMLQPNIIQQPLHEY